MNQIFAPFIIFHNQKRFQGCYVIIEFFILKMRKLYMRYKGYGLEMDGFEKCMFC